MLERNADGEAKMHYLPYDNSKRDEWLQDSEEDSARIAMAFSKSTYLAEDKDEAFKTLRIYFKKYMRKNSE